MSMNIQANVSKRLCSLRSLPLSIRPRSKLLARGWFSTQGAPDMQLGVPSVDFRARLFQIKAFGARLVFDPGRDRHARESHLWTFVRTHYALLERAPVYLSEMW